MNYENLKILNLMKIAICYNLQSLNNNSNYLYNRLEEIDNDIYLEKVLYLCKTGKSYK